MLQNYIFVPLDIFRKTMENKGIRIKLDAWLAKKSNWLVRRSSWK